MANLDSPAGVVGMYGTRSWLYRMGVDVVPWVGVSGVVVGATTVDRTIPQIVRTSQGKLSGMTTGLRWSLFRRVIGKQAGVKTAQFSAMRETKLSLDKALGNPALSTMLAYGITGVPFQSLLYNMLIADTYRFRGLAATSMGSASEFMRRTVAPGVLWCFIRECCATGGGIYFGGALHQLATEAALRRGMPEPPEKLSRFACGLTAGAGCALFTQWLHNTALTAGRLSALDHATESPHYTVVSLRQAWRDLGPKMFYANYPQRMVVIAVASGTMNLCNIFRNPELSIFSAYQN